MFLILILCLLDWLDFWAEVHLVQEVNCECNTFHKKNNQEHLRQHHFFFFLKKGGNLPAFHWVFRWFKFTLKPPYRIAIGNFFSAIWDTSHWNFLVKFGLKTAWDMSYDILLSLLKFVNFWRLQGHLSILAKIGCLQKIKVFSMKERRGFDATWGF